MQHVLFVITSFSTGGVTSSLKSILNSRLNKQYKFSVYALIEVGEHTCGFKKWAIRGNYLTTACRVNRDNVSGMRWLTTQLTRIMIRIVSFFGGNLIRIIDKKTVKKLENNYHFDKVVAFSEGEPTRFVSYFHNIHRLAWIHCDYVRCVKDKSKEGQLYSCFETIVCVSAFTKKSFETLFPQLTQRTIYIYNILDTERIRLLSKETINNPLFNNDCYTIISVGRISEVKRFDSIPHIAKELKKKGFLFKWYVIGPKAEEEAYKKLVNNIKIEDVEDIVIRLGEINNPYPYFVAANLLVSLSWSEACPMVFNEAKILNIPIVSTDFASAYEFIDEGTHGLIRPLDLVPEAIGDYINGKAIVELNDNSQDHYNSNIINAISTLFD